VQRSLVVFVVFERFTEKAIKSVMFAQRESKALGKSEVENHHLLMGLITENSRSSGHLKKLGNRIQRLLKEIAIKSGDVYIPHGVAIPALDITLFRIECSSSSFKELNKNILQCFRLGLCIHLGPSLPSLQLIHLC
jgi:hypothetical protein